MRLPLVMRLSECVIRFLLAAVLSGAELFGGHALFGLTMVGATGAGLEGFAALLGAALGYLSFRGFLEGLRYIAAAMMIFAVSMALCDFRVYRTPWFMPLVSAALNGLVGFVYLSAGGWTAQRVIYFATEVVMTAAGVYFYRLAFSVWEEKREETRLSVPQTVGVLVLGCTVLMTLSNVTVGDTVSVGRVLAAVAVMVAGWKGGVGTGAAAGVAAGLAMDLSALACPYYTMTYGFAGLVTGVFARQGRLLAVLGYALSSGAAVLWNWTDSGQLDHMYEVLIASVIFLLLPDKLLRRFAALTRQEGAREEDTRTRRYTAGQLRRTAAAFRAVSAGVENLYTTPGNDGDAAKIFDRAAERVCLNCTQSALCWQRDYQTTRTALNDALPRLLDQGTGESRDFPGYFSARCIHFSDFLSEVNTELEHLLTRRMYDSRVRESRAAVCAQYSQLAQVLDRCADQVGADLPVDVRRQRQVKQRLAALGLEGRCAVFSDEHGHLRLELEGKDVETLGKPEELERLAQLVGCPLRVEEQGDGLLRLAQKEPMLAVAGVAALGKDGMPVSGDSGAWFKDEAGQLYFLLCDGMGSGLAARQDSDSALRLLEKFLRAGQPPRQALSTVGEALALRGEVHGGFTTVDLLQIDLFTGQGAVYKLGAAPTYLRREGRVERLCASSLPAGLMGQGGEEPDVFSLTLAPGDCVVMASDGVSNGQDDDWLIRALEEFDGLSPQTLAQRLLADSRERAGGDDRTVIVVKMDIRG
jgi:stage II sporulation protein E